MNDPSNAPTLDPLQALQAAHEQMARERMQAAMASRNPHAAPKPAGVRVRNSRTGQEQDILDDGSLRNVLPRHSRELSGRQRRLARKRQQRALRQRETA